MVDYNDSANVDLRKNQEDPIVMYLIVREKLGMSIGKTAAQCAHASQMLLLNYIELDKDVNWTAAAHGDPVEQAKTERVMIFKNWLNSSFRKVVLKADDKEWHKIAGSFVEGVMRVTVVDAGLTEIAAGSETVIGIWPMKRSEVPKVIKKLQVLK